MALRDLCERAKVVCRASGDWTLRPVRISRGERLLVVREPGGWGAVEITLPNIDPKSVKAAQMALEVMAYGEMDLVARESIKGAAWAKPVTRRGRPKSGMALSAWERQRAARQRL